MFFILDILKIWCVQLCMEEMLGKETHDSWRDGDWGKYPEKCYWDEIGRMAQK